MIVCVNDRVQEADEGDSGIRFIYSEDRFPSVG